MTPFLSLAQMSGEHHGGWLSAKLLAVFTGDAEWVLWLLAVLALLPQARVDALERQLDLVEPWFSRAFRVVLASFFGFGLLRLVYFLVSRDWFP